MHAVLRTLVAVTSFLSLYSTAASCHPTPVSRAGPSGSVIYPPGGTVYTNPGGGAANDGSGGLGYIYIQYQNFYEVSPFVQTVGVDIYLEDPSGQQADIPLATNFGNPEAASIIEGYFSPPTGACGTYNLVFIEHQNYNFGNVINFRAAAPSISIDCPPIET